MEPTALLGKPDVSSAGVGEGAVKPHVRFDDGKVASAKPGHDSLLLQVFLSAITAVSACVCAQAATVYVDCDSAAETPTGAIDAPYKTIQDGIDNATNGDTVLVVSGTAVQPKTYYISKPVTTPGSTKKMTVIAESSNPRATVIDPQGVTNCVYLSNQYNSSYPLFFAGFTLTNGASRSGTALNSAGVFIGNYVTVSNCVITSIRFPSGSAQTVQGGAVNMNGDNSYLKNSVIENCNSDDLTGTVYGYAINAGWVLDTILRNCVFTGNTGAYALYTQAIGGYDNAINRQWFYENLTIASNSCSGKVVFKLKDATSAKNSIVRNCLVAHNDIVADTVNYDPLWVNNLVYTNLQYCFEPAGVNLPADAETDQYHNKSGAFKFKEGLWMPSRAYAGRDQGLVMDWMTNSVGQCTATDIGNGGYEIEKVGDWGVNIKAKNPRSRFQGGKPEIGACEYWSPAGVKISAK